MVISIVDIVDPFRPDGGAGREFSVEECLAVPIFAIIPEYSVAVLQPLS